MGSRKSEKQLRDMLEEAQRMVPKGSFWRHFKGNNYRVIAIAFEEDTLDFLVVYAPDKHPDLTFARPLSVWLESVEWQGLTLTRFERLSDS